MDPERDDIDPGWWSAAFEDLSAGEYEPPEMLFYRITPLAEQAGIGEFQKMVLEVLARASSAMLKPDDWSEPFSPAMEFGGRRSVIPADLTKEEVAVVARLAPLVDRPELRARLADVAWVYGDRSNVTLLDLAIDAYRAAALTDNVWFGGGKDAWQRAFELARRRGDAGRERIDEMTADLVAHVLSGTVEDRFRIPDCAAMARGHGRVSKTQRGDVAQSLLRLAASALEADPRLSRHLDREAAKWLAADDPDAVHAATDRIARTYIAEADARGAAEPVSGAAVAGTFIEKAIANFRSLPRSYRDANRIDDLISDLRERLHASRETTLENMMHISSDPIDLTDYVSYARERVSGHPDRFEALAMFATLAPPLDAARIRANAESAVDGSLSHIFGSATFSRDARKVAASGGSTRQANDPAVQSEIVRHVSIHAQITAQGMIAPALDVLTFQHRYDRSFITALCAESPAVPEGHAGLWGAGLTLGLTGDFGPAAAILIPQLEQVVRIQLKRRGVHTLFVDEHTGVESEKSLNALLDTSDAAETLGSGTVMELQALLVAQGGANLRNDIAHGLLDDAAAWSYHTMYLWWFCLRLVLWPVIQMATDDAQQQASTESTEPQLSHDADDH